MLKIGQLKEHAADADEIARLLAAAQRSLADARSKAITQTGLAALMAHGYRPDTNRPGHHMTIIQSLTLTLGVDGSRIAVLDTLRRKRNLADYTGEDIDHSSVAECIGQAQRLAEDARAWLRKHRPQFKLK